MDTFAVHNQPTTVHRKPFPHHLTLSPYLPPPVLLKRCPHTSPINTIRNPYTHYRPSIILLPPLIYNSLPFVHLRLLLPQTRPDIRPASLPKFFGILPPQPRRLHIRGALIVRATQHTDHTQKNSLGCLDRRPSFTGRLVTVRVIGRRM